MPASTSQPTIYDIAQRSQIGRWQTVDVTVTSVFSDIVIPHNLSTPTVRFFVVDATTGGKVFRGVKASTAAYIVLQASAVGIYHVVLYAEVEQGAQQTAASASGGNANFGTFTPIDVSGANLTFSVAMGKYAIGDSVAHVDLVVNYPVTADGSNAQIGGLPFKGTTVAGSGAVGFYNGATPPTALLQVGNAGMTFFQAGVQQTNANLSAKNIAVSLSYVIAV